MSLVLVVSLALVACHPGKASIVRPSADEPEEAGSPPMIRTSRCLEDPLQSVRKTILDSLNLQAEPHVSVPGMAQIREQWRNMFTSTTNPVEQNTGDNKPPSSFSSSSSSSGNATHLQCCMFASQVFMKDLGWDEWMIYPESFTFVRCGVCAPQQKELVLNCRDDDPSAPDPPSQKPCCEATSHDLVPVLYMDETSSLVISTVPQTRRCGCGRSDEPQALQP